MSSVTPLPKHLEEMRDELACEWVQKDDGSLGHCPDCYKCGFDQAASIMLKDMEEMAKALEFYANDNNWTNTSQFHPHVKMRIESWDAYHPDNNPNAPYCERVGGRQAREALKNYREKYGVKP